MHADTLIKNYQQELGLIQNLMAEFAKEHPKVAARLRLNKQGISDDDQMGRLIESIALLGAKARFHLNDEFSEISDNFLAHLHPHAIAPIPAMSVVQLNVEQQKSASNNYIPEDSVLFAESAQEQMCTFITRYPVPLLPLQIREAVIMKKPLKAPVVPVLMQSSHVLCIALDSIHPKLVLADTSIYSLRFFIKAEDKLAYGLYEALFNEALEVALAISPDDKDPILLGKKCIKKVGFDHGAGMLPYGKHTPIGYRLLTEFFAFPHKFLFFDIDGIQEVVAKKFKKLGENVEIYIYFKSIDPYLAKNIKTHHFALHCTPVVNLFAKKCERFSITNDQFTYPLNPSERKSVHEMEIYQVKQVTAFSDAEKNIEIRPFYKLGYEQDAYYYHIERKPAWYFGHYPVLGSEIGLRFSDFENNVLQTKDWKIVVEALCTNRNLAMAFNMQQSQVLRLEKKIDVVKEAKAITPFTPTHHPFLNENYKWQYVSHLSLNTLWCLFLNEGTLFFCSLINLYAFGNAKKYNGLYESILNVRCRNAYVIKKKAMNASPIWHGIEIVITIDETKFENKWFYLFFCVLNCFFPAFVGKDFYTQLIIKNKEKLLYEFSPCEGQKQLF